MKRVIGTSVIFRGEIVAWFSEFTDEAQNFCTENYFGEWLTWRAYKPVSKPLTKTEIAKANAAAKEFKKLFKDTPK